MVGLVLGVFSFLVYVGVGIVSLAAGFVLPVVVCGVINDTWKSSFYGKLSILLGTPVVLVYIAWAVKLSQADILTFFR